MYKILNNVAAPNLNSMFHKMSNCPISYKLRNSNTDLVLPKPKTGFKKRSFSYNGTFFWNNLSVEEKKSQYFDLFEKAHLTLELHYKSYTLLKIL